MRFVGPETDNLTPVPADVAAVVVTYHPGEGLSELLASISRQVGRIVVVDNHSPADKVAFLRNECLRYGCDLIENDANLGIARALNLGVQHVARKASAGWVVFFDQDSQPSEDQVGSLLSILGQHPTADTLGVIGSNYIDLPMGNVRYLATNESSDPWIPHDFAITSGSLVSMASLRATGGFRDEFFIDCVDFDYSFRARVAGFETVISREPLMAHTVGRPLTGKFGRWEFASSNHRAERRYYRVRNIVVLLKEHVLAHPGWVIPRFASMIKSVLLMCILERQRTRKLKFVLRGFWDGMRSDFRFSPLGESVAYPLEAQVVSTAQVASEKAS
jgi:rhamnosyltransferase